MDLDVDTTVDVPVGDALCCFIQLLEPFRLKLLAGCLFCHLLQHSLDVRGGVLVQFPFVVVVILGTTANRSRHGISLVERNPPAFFIRGFLLPGCSIWTIQRSTDGVRAIRSRTIFRISLARIGCFFGRVLRRLITPRLVWI